MKESVKDQRAESGHSLCTKIETYSFSTLNSGNEHINRNSNEQQQAHSHAKPRILDELANRPNRGAITWCSLALLIVTWVHWMFEANVEGRRIY
jgi:hypothetical protein